MKQKKAYWKRTAPVILATCLLCACGAQGAGSVRQPQATSAESGAGSQSMAQSEAQGVAQSNSKSGTQSEVSSGASASGSETEGSGKENSAAQNAVEMAGVYVSQADFPDEYRPTLTLNENGTFLLVENLMEGMGEYTGTYEVNDGTVLCTVATSSFSGGGFPGGNASEISFSIEKENTLKLERYLAGSCRDDLFALKS